MVGARSKVEPSGGYGPLVAVDPMLEAEFCFAYPRQRPSIGRLPSHLRSRIDRSRDHE
jgi:hypothetical protein